MPVIPANVLKERRAIQGLTSLGIGKVRDTFGIPNFPNVLMSRTGKGISALDVVLPALIPDKDCVLNAMTDFWEREVFKGLFYTDRLATGAEIDQYLPEHLRKNPELQKTCRIVNKLNMFRGEFVLRGNLTGSGWTEYKNNGTVCGRRIATGLVDGSELPFTTFSPTTKAEEGHDEAISPEKAIELFGHEPVMRAIEIFEFARWFAHKRGIIIADTKFEFGKNSEGFVTLGDEILTPDSSRFWPIAGWEKAMLAGKTPPSFDKDPVRAFLRQFCKDHGIEKMDPKNPEHVRIIHGMDFPEPIIRTTRQLYRYAFWSMAGMMLETYQDTKMGISVRAPSRHIEVLVGSESDLSQTEVGMASVLGAANVTISVLSCHRNFDRLPEIAQDRLCKADVVIAGAGMAAALPGIIKAQLCALDRSDIPVIGVAFAGPTTKDNQAAILSIECLPGQPVELDENGNAYFGSDGFQDACIAASRNEFLPKTIQAKPVQLGIRHVEALD